jgi:hypothetical protein
MFAPLAMPGKSTFSKPQTYLTCFASVYAALLQPGGSVFCACSDTMGVNRVFITLSYQKGAMVLTMHRLCWASMPSYCVRNYLKTLHYALFARTVDMRTHFEHGVGSGSVFFLSKLDYGKGFPSLKSLLPCPKTT